jgi:hypothetical protein
MKGQDIYHNIPIFGFIFGTVFLSILSTWIYNNTNRSILAALLFHTVENLAHFIFPAMGTKLGGLISVILNVCVVIIVLIIWGPKSLVRKQRIKKHHLPANKRLYYASLLFSVNSSIYQMLDVIDNDLWIW